MIIFFLLLIYSVSVATVIYYYCKANIGVHLLAFVFLLTPVVNTLYVLLLIVRGKFSIKSLREQFKELIQ